MCLDARDLDAPIHPGEVLGEDYLELLELSAYRLAKDIGVPVNRVTAILKGKRSITADTALRLARYFGTTPRLWLNLQTAYDLEVAEREIGDKLDAQIRPAALG
ncbi:MAG: addiction module antidote protein, HigA family [Deltaproteobacteria bacterium]|nr:MAG: addiction module antidote protein, HigA family [Deltaproteobacteria bacterium]